MPGKVPPKLSTSIALAKERLRKLEARQREEERATEQARWIAAGKVVAGCGLLDMQAGELATILHLGVAAWVQSDHQAFIVEDAGTETDEK